MWLHDNYFRDVFFVFWLKECFDKRSFEVFFFCVYVFEKKLFINVLIVYIKNKTKKQKNKNKKKKKKKARVSK